MIMALFLYILITGYFLQIRQEYLAPSERNLNNPLCKSVPFTHSGSFLMDINGNWEGNPQFSYSDAVYVLSADNLGITTQEYGVMVDDFHTKVTYLGQTIAPHLDVAQQLLTWMTFVHSPPTLAANARFYLNADPAVIFQRQYLSVSLVDEYRVCRSAHHLAFDPATATLRWTLSVAAYEEDANCSAIAQPHLLGAISNYTVPIGTNNATTEADAIDAETWDVQIDMRTLMIALALNLGLLNRTDCQRVAGSDTFIHVANLSSSLLDEEPSLKGDLTAVPFASYLDTRYPGMLPVWCGTSAVFPHCVVRLGTAMGFPLLHHAGNASAVPSQLAERCLCTSSMSISPACHTFRLMVGVVFYNAGDTSSALLVRLAARYTTSGLLDVTYRPMWAASAFRDPKLATDATTQAQLYSFCEFDGLGTCSFVVFSLYDVDAAFDLRAVTSSYWPLRQAACQNTFDLVNATAWQQLRAQPFAPLIQSYVTCHNDPWQSLSDNVGIASGWATLLWPYLLMFVVSTFVVAQRLWGIAAEDAPSSSSSPSTKMIMVTAASTTAGNGLAGGLCIVNTTGGVGGGSGGSVADVSQMSLSRSSSKVSPSDASFPSEHPPPPDLYPPTFVVQQQQQLDEAWSALTTSQQQMLLALAQRIPWETLPNFPITTTTPTVSTAHTTARTSNSAPSSLMWRPQQGQHHHHHHHTTSIPVQDSSRAVDVLGGGDSASVRRDGVGRSSVSSAASSAQGSISASSSWCSLHSSLGGDDAV